METGQQNFLPESKLPQNLVGCQVKIFGTYIGKVTEGIEGENGEDWKIDYGRGDLGIRPDEVVRARVLSLPGFDTKDKN